MNKQCTKCLEIRSLDSFYKDKEKRDGLCSKCKTCHKANRDNNNKNRKAYYERNREKILSQFRTAYHNNPMLSKDRDLKKAYGIDLITYNELLAAQDNACAICKVDKSNFNRALAVDHCHKTGKVRGLLCTNCNRAVGNIKDSIESAINLVTYLRDFYDNK